MLSRYQVPYNHSARGQAPALTALDFRLGDTDPTNQGTALMLDG